MHGQLNRTPRQAATFTAIVGAMAISLWLAPGAMAAPFNVTPGSNANDAADPTPADGVCDVGGGICTVRAAIQSANGSPGTDDVNIPAGTYTLSTAGTAESAAATGDLDINGSVNINGLGAGATIDANMIERVFEITTGIVTMDRLTITDGRIATNVGAGVDGGGGIRVAGGTLALTNSAVTGNQVSLTSGTAAGGGIWNPGGIVTLTDSTVSDNSANTMASGGGFGGGIDTLDDVTLTRSTVDGNSAGGPGIAGSGGGISASAAMGVVITIQNSTISGNTAGGVGVNGSGGGIFSGGATSTISNSTIVNNLAAGTGTGGNIAATAYTVRNTIIANGTATTGQNCSVGQSSQGYNLESPTNQCALNGTGDQVSVPDPGLAGLANNGGPTETHRLLTGSPAINAGNPLAPGGIAPACLATDQRGQARGGVAGICDIGAYEKQPPALNPVGDKTVQAGQTLSFAIAATDPDSFDTLTFSGSMLPAGASVDPSGVFSWTPSAAQVGSHPNVGLAVTDGTFNDSETITITVTPVPPPPPPAGGSTTPATVPTPPGPTGQRAAALKKCKKKKGKARANCKKKANKLPV